MLFDPFVPLSPLPNTAKRVGFLPPADLTDGDSDVVLTMDLPGLTAEDVDVDVVDGELIVRGERRRPELAEGSRWAFAERTFGRFERRVRLPDGVDPDAIAASLDNGVLSLIVPKPQAMRPRTIAIGSGHRQPRLETATA